LHYRITEDASPRQLAAACAILSADELERHDRLGRTDDRRDYALAHALLRTSLSQYFDVAPGKWEFSADPKGKPAVLTPVNPRLSVSLSHTRGLVACAITTGGELGVDAERTDITFDPAEVASRFFTKDEQRQLERCTAGERNSHFVNLWTLKEAYAKATGLGIGAGLSSVGFDVNGSAVRLKGTAAVNAEDWHFQVVDLAPHFRIAVAIICPQPIAWKVSIVSTRNAPHATNNPAHFAPDRADSAAVRRLEDV
jgi:4'-phosphopantetheinyl transferase